MPSGVKGSIRQPVEPNSKPLNAGIVNVDIEFLLEKIEI